MTLVQYVLAVLVAFSGVLVGAFLACFAKEEMPTARKYFPLIGAVLFAVFAVFFFLLAHSPQGLFAVSALVFLYGFPAGSMFVVRKNEFRPVRAVLIAAKRYSYFAALAVVLEVVYVVFS